MIIHTQAYFFKNKMLTDSHSLQVYLSSVQVVKRKKSRSSNIFLKHA